MIAASAILIGRQEAVQPEPEPSAVPRAICYTSEHQAIMLDPRRRAAETTHHAAQTHRGVVLGEWRLCRHCGDHLFLSAAPRRTP